MKDCLSQPVSAAMTRNVACVSPDTSLAVLIQLFFDRAISGAPVVDADGQPLGVVSKADVIRAGWGRDWGLRATLDVLHGSREAIELQLETGFDARRLLGMTAGDLMTPLPMTVCEEEAVGRAAAMMAHERVHRLPVLSAEGRVVGILSTLDVLRFVAAADGFCA